MFPLGLTLVPGALLPLYLFEDRYLQLYEDIVAGDREFGVVLIERGTELNDQNKTFSVGCVAQLLGSGIHENGSISIVTEGRQRFRVLEWRTPDPYPIAIVELLPQDQPTEVGAARLAKAISRLPDLLEAAARLDTSIGTEVPAFSDDLSVATFQLAQLCGPQTLDLQRILEGPTADIRVGLVAELLEEQIELIELQIGMS